MCAWTEEEIGFKDYAPPFLAPNTTGDMILKGVNYASSGAGILQATGAVFVRLISSLFCWVAKLYR